MKTPTSTPAPNPTSSCRQSKTPLLTGWREWGLFLALCALVALLSLGWRYAQYRDFVSQKKRFAEADVLLHYTKTKKGRTYDVLKLSMGAMSFYTTARKPLPRNLRGERVKVLLFPSRVTFADYLTTPYIPSKILKILPQKSWRMRLYDAIAAQHDDPRLAELYGALFLALPISKPLRHEVARLGVSHLLALSGFHLGLLWAILYGFLSLLYVPLQRRFFPWRLRLLDVGAATLLLLGGYLWLTGMPPSLLRAYAMVAVGWAALLLGLEMLSFGFLAFCVTLLTALFPALLPSLGFWLSVAGVFFIYLFLRWFGHWPNWAVFAGINLWVYLTMAPVVHAVFPLFSPAQLLSPLLSALFIPFYPAMAAAHLAGLGGVCDGCVGRLLAFGASAPAVKTATPLWLLGLFLFLSLLAVRWRAALYLQGMVALGFVVYLVEQVA